MVKILVVDDLEQNRYLLNTILTAVGHEVQEAVNGLEALDLARRRHPVLVVSDILMPQMDGFALCREFKRAESLREIPFIFYTATYTDPRDRDLALQLGAARFIVKPIEGEEFLAILDEVLEEHSQGRLSAPTMDEEEETVFYRLYDEALVRKLEDKMLDLERLNHRLVESQARFESLVQNAADMIVTVDAEGIIRYVSPACEFILGRDTRELTGKSFTDWVHPDDLAESRATFIDWQKSANGEAGPIKIRGKHKNGEWRVLEALGTNLLDDPYVGAIVLNVRDITERARAEAALKESEQLRRLLLESAGEGIFGLDSDGRIVFINPAATRMFRWKADDMIGRDEHRLMHHHHADGRIYPTEDCPIYRTLHDGETRYVENELFFCADGTGFPVEYTCSAMRDDSGLITGAVVSYRDITERKKAEQELRESEARYQLISTLTSDYMFSSRIGADGQAHLTWVGGAFERITGYTYNEFVKLGGWRATLHPDDLQVDDRDMQTLQSNQRIVTELRTLTKSGQVCWVRVYAHPIIDDQSRKLVGIFGAVQDITERKMAEEALRRRLSELEAVSKISAALRSAQTLDEMLPILLDETLAALESDAGSIMLYYPEDDELRPAVDRGWFKNLALVPIRAGEGIAGKVITEGRAIVSREYAVDPTSYTQTVGQVPRGWGGICVPIRSVTQVVGVIYVAVQLPREISLEEARLLSSLAEIAGTALHRLRLNDETERRVKQLQSLRSIDQAIISSLDSGFILDILLEQVTERLRVDAAGVLLYDPDTLHFEFAAARGFNSWAYERSRIRLGEGLAGRAALERRYLLVGDGLEKSEFTRAELLNNEEFHSYAVMPFMAKGQIKGVVEIFNRRPLQPDVEWMGFLEALADQAAIAIDNIQLFHSLRRSNSELIIAYDTTIEGWSRALDLRDKETEGHTLRVTDLTLKLARAAGMSQEELVHVRRGALLHDIGKMGVPDAILLKPGKLTDEEWIIMRQHPQLAFDMLSFIPYLRPALDIPYCHHERWDGSGYPRGLRGRQIPLAARLFSVVDVWDALRSDRPYRPGWQEEDVLRYIRENSGMLFDPQVVEHFFQVLNDNGGES